MSKRDWTLIISLVIGVWAIDLITKEIAERTIHSMKFYGPVGFIFHRNPGAMLGMFADLPKLLRVVTLSTGGAFLVFIYAAIQYLLPLRSIVLRCGMSILLGGILGNVTDRILEGSVRDFIMLGSIAKATPAFNFADAIQWVGYAMVVYSLIKDGNQFWPEMNTRKKVWVYPKFQIKYIFILISIGIGFSVISGVFSYTYIWVTIQDLVGGRSSIIEKKFLVPFLLTYASISTGFVVILFLLGRVLSHRTAGPVYAFERFLEDIINGDKDRKLKLRAGDEFKHLEELAHSIGLTLYEKVVEKDGVPHTEPIIEEEEPLTAEHDSPEESPELAASSDVSKSTS